MGSSQYLIYIAFIAGVVAYTLWVRKRSAQAHEQAKPAYLAFFERTGYRYADIADRPPQAQVERAFADAKRPQTGSFDVHYVRSFHGFNVHYRSSQGTRKEGTKSVFWRSNSWEVELTSLPRVPIHIADKALDSSLKAVRDAFSSSARQFSPKASQRVPTGVADVDSRLVVFAEDAEAVRAVFVQNPVLPSLLSGWAELDVSVAGGRAIFADPTQKNIAAAMGGMIGSMAIGFDIGKRIELSIPVHDRVAELLATLIRATA